MSLHIEHHDEPEVKRPRFTIDKPLNKRMPPSYTLLQHLNRNFCCGVIGKPGSGKTSLVTSLFTSRKIYRKCFHLIIVFMPPHSLSSMTDQSCPWYRLPRDQLFSELSPETMARAWALIQTRKAHYKDFQALIVFDDVQVAYHDVERQMLDWSANRRHYHLSMFVIGQSYKKLPRMFRSSMSDLFAFRLSNGDLEDIEKELFAGSKKEWRDILHAYAHDPAAHSFLYLHITGQRVFLNWSEVLMR